MLKTLRLRAGVSKENTRYASEVLGAGNLNAPTIGGWYESDKVRFRSGTPEKIGGWVRISSNTFLGICRSLFNWVTLAGKNLMGVGTNLKFYIEDGGGYNDITPLRATASLTNPFTAVDGSSTITVNDVAHGAAVGDFVTFSGATGLGGNISSAVLNAEHVVTGLVDADNYRISVGVTANATDAAGSPGGGTVSAAYQIPVGFAYAMPMAGYGAGGYGAGGYGVGLTSTVGIRVWTQAAFGEDLIFAYRGGPIYYWDATSGIGARGVALSSLSGASDVPVVQNGVFVSDTSRFVFALGCNELGSSTMDPLLIRWSDQESAVDWTPSALNQAGGIRLSQGSSIVTAVQSRQELVVFTDTALYSLQYVGQPAVWSTSILGSNISIVSQNSVVIASGVLFWMGVDKFYRYDGRVQTLRCDLRQHVFGDINKDQYQQVFAGTNEGFNEVWWFYCSAGASDIDRYVVYNYLEDIWYYGTMARTAWTDSGLRNYPTAATYHNNLVEHENGVDDNALAAPQAIEAYVSSTEFDIDDGHNFGFVWRLLPDITFRGSEPPAGEAPQATFTLIPLHNSGSGYSNPQSVGGSSTATIQRIATAPVEEFTGQVYIRVRGRQMVLKVSSNQLGTTWQLGAPRIDVRPDGRKA